MDICQKHMRMSKNARHLRTLCIHALGVGCCKHFSHSKKHNQKEKNIESLSLNAKICLYFKNLMPGHIHLDYDFYTKRKVELDENMMSLWHNFKLPKKFETKLKGQYAE